MHSYVPACRHTHRALDPTNKNTHFLSSHKTSDKITYTDHTPSPQHTFYTVYYLGAEVLKQGWSHTEGTPGHVSDICGHQMGRTREAAQQHPSVPRTAPHRDWPGPNVPSAEEETLLYGKTGLFEELKINFKKGHGGSTGDSTRCPLGAPLRGPEPSSRSSPGQSLSPPGEGINTRARLGGPTGQVHTAPGRQHRDMAN